MALGSRLGDWPRAVDIELAYAFHGHLSHLIRGGEIAKVPRPGPVCFVSARSQSFDSHSEPLAARGVTKVPTPAFLDGSQYRIEIPTVESLAAFQAVLEEAARQDVLVHRISQGSGMMMLTELEIAEMVSLGRRENIEVCLFVGPRAAWDIGGMAGSASGAAVRANLRGQDHLSYAIRDIERGCRLGVRNIMFADLGLLSIVADMKRTGRLPEDLMLKVSVMGGYSNPASIQLLQELGASTINIPTDLSIPQIASLRAAVSVPLDIYIESPDEFGGFLRYYELPDSVAAAAPVYLKFGVRNAPSLYPWGQHLEEICIKLAREKVRRAKLGMEILKDSGGNLQHRQAALEIAH